MQSWLASCSELSKPLGESPWERTQTALAPYVLDNAKGACFEDLIERENLALTRPISDAQRLAYLACPKSDVWTCVGAGAGESLLDEWVVTSGAIKPWTVVRFANIFSSYNFAAVSETLTNSLTAWVDDFDFSQGDFRRFWISLNTATNPVNEIWPEYRLSLAAIADSSLRIHFDPHGQIHCS